jgi:hypothetical protein
MPIAQQQRTKFYTKLTMLLFLRKEIIDERNERIDFSRG